ncbi:MAG: RNB domain-containing ribonuclease, partial [Proteobacteria bacterium]|nr:RNB domain-containing ribonuclease [Pseudomonadota bacterium]
RVLRESLVRLENIPLIFKVPSMPTLPPGTRVQLAIDSTDLIDVDVRATYQETLPATGNEAPVEEEDIPELAAVDTPEAPPAAETPAPEAS